MTQAGEQPTNSGAEPAAAAAASGSGTTHGTDRPEGLSPREFDERYNLAHLDAGLPRASVRQVLKHYLGSLALYGSLLLFVVLNPWFRMLLSITYKEVTGTQIYCGLFAAYAVLSPLVLLVTRPRSLWKSKNLLIWGWLGRTLRAACGRDFRREWRRCRPDYPESQAMMFLLIKLVYGPLMLHSALFELNKFQPLLFRFQFDPTGLYALDLWFLLFVAGVLVLDSALFFMGYTTEAGFLRNQLRYAETNVWRILVCIACYAPFNMVTVSLLGPSNYDVRILFRGDVEHPLTWVLRGLAVVFLLVMVSSSLFLFTRASNLTNRGIVQRGPYAVVRHPGYVAKNLFWLTTLMPLFFPDPSAADFTWGAHALVCVQTASGWLGWGTLYFLRAITEEQFLSRDPEYVAYCRKVRYRFLPGVY